MLPSDLLVRSDLLVINEAGQAVLCRQPACPFDSIGGRLAELQATLDHPLDLEDLTALAPLPSSREPALTVSR